jgi:spermidine synthase
MHRMRLNARDFSPEWSGAMRYMEEAVSEAARLFSGGTSVCYAGKGGARPFSEHDGSFEDLSRISVTYEVEEWYPKPASQFQDLEVFRSKFFGKVLVIDDEIMITERDETHYHEMLAHVPLAYTPDAAHRPNREGLRVLIIGGGDGGTLTQVLQHNDVTHVTIIELDPAVVAASREHFPHLAAAYDDPRVTLRHENGAKWIAEYAGREYFDDSELDAAFDGVLGVGDERVRATRRPVMNRGIGGGRGRGRDRDPSDADADAAPPLLGPAFDVMLVDSTDFGVAKPLFTRSFYENAHRILAPDTGILCFNVESPSWAETTVTTVTQFLSTIFRHAYPYQLHMPTYSSGHYSFLLASDGVHPYRQAIDWTRFRGKGFAESLQYYSPEIHVGAFALPNRIGGSSRIRLEDLHGSLGRSTL